MGSLSIQSEVHILWNTSQAHVPASTCVTHSHTLTWWCSPPPASLTPSLSQWDAHWTFPPPLLPPPTHSNALPFSLNPPMAVLGVAICVLEGPRGEPSNVDHGRAFRLAVERRIWKELPCVVRHVQYSVFNVFSSKVMHHQTQCKWWIIDFALIHTSKLYYYTYDCTICHK